VRSGLERAALLKPATGYGELVAGLASPFSGAPEWLVRAEVGWRPHESLSVFGFGEVHRVGLAAGVGAKIVW
jgi:hypothetical protein